MKLDKSKSYGLIIGATDGSMYDQNGKIFDRDGNLLGNPVSEDSVQPIKITEFAKLGRPRKEVNHG